MRLATFLSENARWLAAGALLTFLSSFGQTFFISIFAGQIMETHGLSHGQWGGLYTLGTGASAVVMLWAGSLTDRYRARAIGAAILSLLAATCLWMALNPFAAMVPFIIFALRFSGQGMASHIAVVSMSRWFTATRGRALSVAGLGFALGEAVLPVAFVSLMVVMDWRWLWVLAALIVLLAIPVLWRLLREERTPQSMAHENQSAGMGDVHWTRAKVLRHPLFWFMVPALLGPSAFNTAFFFNQVHFAEIKALSHLQLVALFPMYTALAVAAMVMTGWALDRLGTPRLIPWYQLPMVAGFLIFSLGDSPATILIGLLFLALTTGANSVLPNAFWAEFYGTRHIGSIKAMAAAVMVLGSAIGPGITGVLIDVDIGLETQYLWVAGYFVFATGMMAIGVGRAKHGL
ncbi:MFS transporter [Cognatishimia sp. F0-27]|uniref:MFS transporter n=1 Tax=Cognatishimia sp. F0-27 TaxID=2816855 RepID=UPI001D0CA1A6|nr:MFS transporter [Cognatishimia sp. F0-27]MCC1492441.1 MFS transporter [Cognatishimia sp. F0-27]